MALKKVTSSSLWNQDRKKNQARRLGFFTKYSNGNVAELNDLIYVEVKLVRGEIDIRLRNPNRNTKPDWGMRLERQIKKVK